MNCLQNSHILPFIAVPPHSFDFSHELSPKTGDLELECQAKGVYPRPNLTLSQSTHSSASGANFHLFTDVNISTEQSGDSALYDVSLKHIFSPMNNLHQPSASHPTSNGAVFECKLEIPRTNYMRGKRITFYPSK